MVHAAKLAKIYSATEVRERLSAVVRALRAIEEANCDVLGKHLLPELLRLTGYVGANRLDFKLWAAGPVSRSGGGNGTSGQGIGGQGSVQPVDRFPQRQATWLPREGQWHVVAKTLHATEEGLYSTMLKLQKNLRQTKVVFDRIMPGLFSTRTEKV